VGLVEAAHLLGELADRLFEGRHAALELGHFVGCVVRFGLDVHGIGTEQATIQSSQEEEDRMRRLPTIDPGHVANCSATDCLHNRERACHAPSGVQITFHRDHADCNTYTRNEHKPS
jgi:hypothetical protein